MVRTTNVTGTGECRSRDRLGSVSMLANNQKLSAFATRDGGAGQHMPRKKPASATHHDSNESSNDPVAHRVSSAIEYS